MAIAIASEWSEARLTERRIEEPTWQDIEALIRALNQANFQEVYLHPEGENPATWLCVGGGNGKYVVAGSVNNETFPTYIDSSRSAEPMVAVTIGGQTSEYAASSIASLEQALRLARAFYDAEGFDCGVEWRDGYPS